MIREKYKKVVEYLIAIVLVLSTAVIWTVGLNTFLTFDLCRYSFLFLGLMAFTTVSHLKISRNDIFKILVLVVYLLIYIAMNHYNYLAYFRFFLLPTCVYLLYFVVDRGSNGVLQAFSNIVFILAGISLVLYVFGPLLGIISPTGRYAFHWAYNRSCNTYFNLLYESQNYGYSIFTRNCGIFAEAPMYNMVLCISLAYELFLSKKTSLLKQVVLSVAVISTLTTTGLICILLIGLLKYMLLLSGKRGFTIGKVVLPVVVVLVIIVALNLLEMKAGSTIGLNSTSTRSDHLSACLKAFFSHPFLGVGFNNEDAVLALSQYKVGISVGLAYLLATGGIFLILPYIVISVNIVKATLARKDYGYLAFFITYLILFFLTAITYRPLMIFLSCYFFTYNKG